MESELRNLLNAWAESFASDQSLPISFANIPFDPPTERDSQYLDVMFFATNPDVMTVCNAGSVYTWLFQVSVYYRDSLGEIKAHDTVDALREALFPPMRLTSANHTFQITRPASVAPPVPDDAWQFVPVTFTVVETG